MSTISLDSVVSATERRRARARSRAREAILQAIAEGTITRAELARRMGVNKSRITRDLTALRNFTVDALSDYAAALGRQACFSFQTPEEAGAERYRRFEREFVTLEPYDTSATATAGVFLCAEETPRTESPNPPVVRVSSGSQK